MPCTVRTRDNFCFPLCGHSNARNKNLILNSDRKLHVNSLEIFQLLINQVFNSFNGGLSETSLPLVDI